MNNHRGLETMPHLDVENNEEYKKISQEILLLEHVKRYYLNNQDMYSLELNGVGLRELIRYMNEHRYPKRKLSSVEIKGMVERIDSEIARMRKEQSVMRHQEIKNRDLNSLLIIPSWNAILQRRFNGFYLNRPVIDLRRDTVVMVTAQTFESADYYGDKISLVTGPGIFYTEFATDPGKYIVNVREINMLLLPEVHLKKLLEAPSSIHSKSFNGTINDYLALIPFHIIESAYSIQALTRGVVRRSVFHPNKPALDAFLKQVKDKDSYRKIDGFKILSAHPHYYNRLLLTKPPKTSGADSFYNLSSAGIAAILDNGQRLIDEIIPPMKQLEILEKILKVKKQYVELGHRILTDWMP